MNEISWHNAQLSFPKDGVEVIGYNPDWVDNSNLKGIRICVYIDEIWVSAKWEDEYKNYFSVDESPKWWASIQPFTEKGEDVTANGFYQEIPNTNAKPV
jgi:hypothetical protein